MALFPLIPKRSNAPQLCECDAENRFSGIPPGDFLAFGIRPADHRTLPLRHRRTIGNDMRDSRAALCGNVPSAIEAGWSPSGSCPKSVLRRLSRTPHDRSPCQSGLPQLRARNHRVEGVVLSCGSKPFSSQRDALHFAPCRLPEASISRFPRASFPRLPTDCSPWLVSDSSNKTHSATASAAV
jgi:hypothetical protein